MDVYIEKATEKQIYKDRYKIFFKNPKYLYLIQNDTIDVIKNHFYTRYRFVIQKINFYIKYNTDKSVYDNFIYSEELFNNDKQIIIDNMKLITNGNIYDKLFCDSFFVNWGYVSYNYLFTAYIYLHHGDIFNVNADLNDIDCKLALYYLNVDYKNNICKIIDDENYENFMNDHYKLLHDKIKYEYNIDYSLKDNTNCQIGPKYYSKYETNQKLIKEIMNYGQIIINGIIYPFNSGATMHFFDIGSDYEETQIELIEKYGTVNVISLVHAIHYPHLYKIDNEHKIYYFRNRNKINLEIQGYYNIVFELIVQNQFTLVNLYKATGGDLRIFNEILIFSLPNPVIVPILHELEYYPDIIIKLVKSNLDTRIILEYLIEQEPIHF